MHHNIKNILHEKFGRLRVEKFLGSKSYVAYWLCRCVCGNTTEVAGHNLRSGGTQSCGCLKLERIRQANSTHGKSLAREYYIWRSMRSRCQKHPDYAGRGIRVCKRWSTSFESFYSDMGPVPGPGYTLDRIRNHLGYSPGNCRWVTQKVNNRNKRNNRLLTHGGRTQCASAWSEETGICRETILGRLKRGWSVEEALTKKLPR